MIDFARWYLGDIRRVNAHLPTLIDRSAFKNRPAAPSTDAAVVSMEMQTGAQVLVQAGAVAHVGNQVVRIVVQLYGDAGSLEAEHIFLGRDAGVTLRGIRQDQNEFQSLEVPADLTAGLDPAQLMDPYVKRSAGPRWFIDAILRDEPAKPDFHDALKVQEVVDAALQSHRDGGWASLE